MFDRVLITPLKECLGPNQISMIELFSENSLGLKAMTLITLATADRL